MRFTLKRELLFKPLQAIVGIAERRQTMPILSHVLLAIVDNQLYVTGTDLEAEIIANVPLESSSTLSGGKTTVSARKLLDVCRAADGEIIEFWQEDRRFMISAGKAKFTLATLTPDGFPKIDWKKSREQISFSLPQKILLDLLESTIFAIAQQDTRQYLNGLLLEIKDGKMIVVASDSFRLATNCHLLQNNADLHKRVIIPRKGITELMKLMNSSDDEVNFMISDNYVKVEWPNYILTSKLIDSKYPEYERTIAYNVNSKKMLLNTVVLKRSLERVSILANDICCGAQLHIGHESLRISISNQEQESGIEEIPVDYAGEEIDISFNVRYLLDAVSNIKSDELLVYFKDSESSILLKESADASNNLHLIMPLRFH